MLPKKIRQRATPLYHSSRRKGQGDSSEMVLIENSKFGLAPHHSFAPERKGVIQWTKYHSVQVLKLYNRGQYLVCPINHLQIMTVWAANVLKMINYLGTN